jgi:tripartite ATP-independent transporter DctP family solute receptor
MEFITRRRVLQAAALSSTLLGGLAGAPLAFGQENIVLRLSHALGKDSPRQHSAELFAKRMGELTNGQVKVEIYSDAELGSEAKSLEGLQTGTIDFGIIAIFPNVVQSAKVLELPFLFRDFNHWKASIHGTPGKRVAESSKGTGLRVLGYQFGGWRDMYGNKEVRGMKDLVGLKIRTQQTPAYVNLFKAAGAIPTPIAWTETYMALQQGTVDAAETLFSSMVDQKQYEVSKFGTVSNHAVTTVAFIVSEAKWASLPEKVRQAIVTAEKDASTLHDTEVLATDPKVIDVMKSRGMTIVDFDTTEMRKLAREKVYPGVVVDGLQKEILAAVEAL